MRVLLAAAALVVSITAGHTAELLPHPKGCPARLFCGCGVAVKVFGEVRRDLWRAAAWFRFPRSSPGPGTVAVNRRHVFYIESVNSDGTVIAYDPNSGGGLTRRHVRSLAGYTVVDPNGNAFRHASVSQPFDRVPIN